MPDIPRKPLDAALVWCRRDLRAHDHAALYHALRAARRVWVAFVFDRAILDALPRADRRVEFIRESLVDLALDRSELAEQPVFIGGPVQTERGFVLHEASDDDAADIEADGATYNSSLRIPGGMAMTTSKDVLEALASGAGPKRVLVTLGYAGWSAGQLEDEIARNGWITVDAQPEVIFETPVELRYERALALLGIDPRMLSQEAGHA